MSYYMIAVLGHRLESDGTASHFMIERLQTAMQHYRALCEQGHHAELLLSGGAPLSYSALTEADVMADILSNKQLCEKNSIPYIKGVTIHCERRSCTTLENLVSIFSYLFSQQLSIDVLEIISSDWHINRINKLITKLHETIELCSFSKEKLQVNAVSAHSIFCQNELTKIRLHEQESLAFLDSNDFKKRFEKLIDSFDFSF